MAMRVMPSFFPARAPDKDWWGRAKASQAAKGIGVGAVALIIGTIDNAVLAAVRDLGPEVTTIAIRDHLAASEGRERPIGDLYADLDRMEQEGLVVFSQGDPTAERGYRPTSLWSITSVGLWRLAEAERPAGPATEAASGLYRAE